MTDITPPWKAAEELYRQARQAELDGDHERAAELRKQADEIFDELEKEMAR